MKFSAAIVAAAATAASAKLEPITMKVCAGGQDGAI